MEIETIIKHYHLADSLGDRQQLALRTISSVLKEGLMTVGGLPDPGKRPDWGLTTDEAMDRLRDLYVQHYDDKAGWEFSVWLGLTDRGKGVAQTPEARKPR